jgi:hypothetical protein
MYKEVEVKLNLKRKWMDAHIKSRKEQKFINKNCTAWGVKMKRMMYNLECFTFLCMGALAAAATLAACTAARCAFATAAAFLTASFAFSFSYS